jgi:hypothetical protein
LYYRFTLKYGYVYFVLLRECGHEQRSSSATKASHRKDERYGQLIAAGCGGDESVGGA